MELVNPTLSHGILVGCGVVILYLVTSSIRSWYRLRHFDGPFGSGFSYWFIFRAVFSGRQGEVYGDVVKKYGNLARIGPNVLITGEAELVRRMNSARTRYERSDYYKAMRMDPYHESLFSIVDGAAHDRLKAQMSFGYGGREVPTLEEDIDGQIDSLVNLLRTKYAQPGQYRPADLASISQHFTIDALSKIAFGKEFGYISADADVYGYIESSMATVKVLVLCAEVPYFRPIFMSTPMLRLFGPGPQDKKGIGRMLGLAQELVAQRFSPEADDKLDMLGSFKRHGCTPLQCEAEIPFQIVAGSDTTAHAIREALLYLMSSPQTYLRLREEIDSAIDTGTISQPITLSEAHQLPYLQGVIYEALRMSAPATLLAMKKAPPEGDTINDKFIPGGTRIAVSIKAITRDRTTFGGDAELFRPERWLDLDPKKKRDMMDTTELIFGYGRFGCSGKPVALLELNKVFVELFRNFDFQLVNPRCAVEETLNIQIHLEKGMWVKVTDRQGGK